jgi:hypothetical protein
VIGVLRPQLILPQRLVSGRAFDQFEAIVAHELVHVRRRDTALLLVELAAKVLWWFHPLVWMASRQASRWRECCCDAETVARLGCSPASYARGLLDVLEHLQVDRSLLALQGHPHADGIARLTEAAQQAGLSDTQLQTLRALAARADWDLERIKEWKRTGQISDAETAALGKLQPFVEHLQSTPNAGEAEKVRVFRQVCQVAGLSDAETEALFEAVKQAGGDEQGLLQAKQAGQLAESAAAGLKKLESLLGKLEDFVDSPHKKEIGKLLEMAARAGLSTEETGVLMKLAAKANHDRETVKQMYDSGGLIDAEVRVVEKVLASQGR